MIDPERWLAISARIPSDDLRPLVAEGMLALGGSAVQEEGEVLTSYLLPPADPKAFVEHARMLLEQSVAPGALVEFSWHWQEDEEWAREWKRGLQPRKVTERLVVKPTWTEWAAQPEEVVIDLDPQMAFGTGEHATTRGCLRLLDGALRLGDRVLDVGSGSGILAIAAAKLGAGEVVAIEEDPDANLNARENLERNGVATDVRLIEARADPALLAELGRFDVILANILSSVIRPLLPAFRTVLRNQGRLIVSGILRDESEVVATDAEAAGFRVVQVDEEENWWSGLLAAQDS